MTATLALVLVLGLLIGGLLGLLGGGGSILAVPALVYVAGLPLDEAIPTSLLVVGLASAAAVLPRLRQVRWRLAGIFAATGAAAAVAGAAVNRLLDPALVLLGFAGVMVAAAVRLLRGGDDVGGSCSLPGGGVDWRSCLPKAAASGVVVGFLTGLFGVGGGFLIVPALTLLLGLPMAAAAATSLVVIATNAAVAFTAHLSHGTISLPITLAFAAAAVVGSVVAGRHATRLDGERLRRSFAYLVLGTAAYTAVHASWTVIT